MTPSARAQAAKTFLANPLMMELFETLRKDNLEGIVATDLKNFEDREMKYLAARSLVEMKGQLEVWAAQVPDARKT